MFSPCTVCPYAVHFQSGWLCYHIDSLQHSKQTLPSVVAMKTLSVSRLFEAAVHPKLPLTPITKFQGKLMSPLIESSGESSMQTIQQDNLSIDSVNTEINESVKFKNIRKSMMTVAAEEGCNQIQIDLVSGHSLKGSDPHYIVNAKETVKNACLTVCKKYFKGLKP